MMGQSSREATIAPWNSRRRFSSFVPRSVTMMLYMLGIFLFVRTGPFKVAA